jgi:hypothetical protein
MRKKMASRGRKIRKNGGEIGEIIVKMRRWWRNQKDYYQSILDIVNHTSSMEEGNSHKFIQPTKERDG